MNLFKTYSFTWWQVGVLKLALLSIGVLIGARWPEFWNGLTTTVIGVAVVATAYSIYNALRQ
jgi:hypothetical protein